MSPSRGQSVSIDRTRRRLVSRKHVSAGRLRLLGISKRGAPCWSRERVRCRDGAVLLREDRAGGLGALPDLPRGAPRQDGDLDGDDTVLHHFELSRGGVGDVEDATFVQGSEGNPVGKRRLLRKRLRPDLGVRPERAGPAAPVPPARRIRAAGRNRRLDRHVCAVRRPLRRAHGHRLERGPRRRRSSVQRAGRAVHAQRVQGQTDRRRQPCARRSGSRSAAAARRLYRWSSSTCSTSTT